MSRCKACDVIMTEQELKKKDPETGEYLDLCSVCHNESLHAALDFIDGVLDGETGATIDLNDLGLQ